MQLREFRPKIVVSPLGDAVAFIYDLTDDIVREGFVQQHELVEF
jgi:hypothetical protein